MKIYTRTGDQGQTSLFGGERVSKTHGRVDAYGTLDELNSALGLCHSLCSSLAGHEKEAAWLEGAQRNLFALGSWLASREASERVAKGEEAFPGAKASRTQLSDAEVKALEQDIDGWEAALPPMKTFILPGGSLTGAHAHLARTICRRAERQVIALAESGETVPGIAIQYLNRLADALFVFARHLNRRAGVAETPWS
jgi:cob(I)alamin adenosyltransferase